MKMQQTLVEALREEKEKNGTLTPENCAVFARRRNLSPSQVWGTATFYSEFCGADDGEINNDASEVRVRGPVLSSDGDFSVYRSLKDKNCSGEKITEALRSAGLKGRGGSGFSVGDKWEMTRVSPAKEKAVICNGSEGEGDTYKDLALMLNAPRRILEGVLIGMMAVGANEGIVYVRSEYPEAEKSLKAALKDVQDRDLLEKGQSLIVFRSAGAYVCGEETALLAALEGRRGEPSLKPPYPSVSGLYGKPTVINNAESFAFVPEALAEGECRTKLYTVTGVVERPGVYELPYGITIDGLAKEAGAGNVKGVQLGGGATGAIIGKENFSFPLSFEGLRPAGLALGTASVRFIGEEESIPGLAADSLGFLAGQSCGKCTPCRFGLRELAQNAQQLCTGAFEGSVEDLKALGEYVAASSRCALGQAAPNALLSGIKNFREEFEEAGRAKI